MTRFDAFMLLCEPANGWRDEAEARAAFLAFERDRLVAAGAEPARLDAEGTAEPHTRIVGHGRAGDCMGPGITRPDAVEDTRTGERTPLYGPPGEPKTPAVLAYAAAHGLEQVTLLTCPACGASYAREPERTGIRLCRKCGGPVDANPPTLAQAQAEHQRERAAAAVLSCFEARVSDDTVKRDPELVCTRCGEVLCDIEHGDTLDVLVGVATDHECQEAK